MVPSRLVRVLLSLLLATMLLAHGSLPAAAEHDGRTIGSLLACDRPVTPPRCTSVGDDRHHHIFIDPTVPAPLADSIREAMAIYDSTYLVLVEDEELSARTDAVAFAADHGQNGAAGWVHCPADSPQGVNHRGDRWCRVQEIHFNLNARYGAFLADHASRVHLACHELGHTIGLRHWGNPPRTDGPTAETCMHADTPNGPTQLHRIDRDHIREYYAGLGHSWPTWRNRFDRASIQFEADIHSHLMVNVRPIVLLTGALSRAG